ncbi:hypothetical protein GCM10023322_63290 [Rugosimonospora acidiphila]|uniref:Uncharacterized protein n=1 Tax=Rugosimonospora acidiphila TaxID=556531 RepID=A0ABP9SI67_9ACTN
MDRPQLIVAIVLVILGAAALLRRQVLWGAVLIITAVLIGPGWSRAFH